MFFYSAYEPGIMALLADLVEAMGEPGSVFVDVGHHSLFMAGRVGQIHAFELFAWARDRMQEKITLNRLEHIQVHACALGAQNETLPFFALEGNNTGTGSFLAGYSPSNNRQRMMLSVKAGDEYFDAMGIGGRRY